MLNLPKIKARFAATFSRVRLCLDFPSTLAIAYAQEAINRAGLPDVSAAMVTRRALAVYMDHLDGLAKAHNSLELEAHMLHCSSTFQPMPEEARQKALQRLNEATPGRPLPPFEDVRYGLGSTAQRAAARAEVSRLDADLYSIQTTTV